MGHMFGDIGIVGDGKAVVKFTNKASTKKGEQQQQQPTKIVVHTETKKGRIAAWGSNNKFPQELLESVRKNGASTSGLGAVRDNHYGSGFLLFEETYENDKNGDTKRKLIQKSIKQYPEIDTFFKENYMKQFHKEIIADLEYLAISFPEYVLSNDYNKITKVERKQAANCRFEIMDEKGVIKNIWLSTKWHTTVDFDSVYAADIRYINPRLTVNEVKEYCKKHKIQNFVRPAYYVMLDESYYPVATWHSAYYSKWIDVANSIPEFKKALFENQMNIKFHIEIDEEYFKRKYQESWDDYSDDEKEKLRKEFVLFIDENLRGNKNAATSIWSMIYKDNEDKPVAGLKITSIDDKLKEGAFLPDGVVANDEILSAIGVDGCIISSGTPGGIGAGSGSDKTAAWNILSARSKPKRETTLSIFEFIQMYNGWDSNLIGAFEDTILTTLDKNPTGTIKTANV